MVNLSPLKSGDRVIIRVGWPRHPVVGRYVGRSRRHLIVAHNHRLYWRRGHRVWPCHR